MVLAEEDPHPRNDSVECDDSEEHVSRYPREEPERTPVRRWMLLVGVASMLM